MKKLGRTHAHHGGKQERKKTAFMMFVRSFALIGHAFTWYFDYNTRDLQYDCSALLETQTTAFVKEIRPAGTQIDNLRAPISVFLETRALGAIIRVRYAGGTTDDASAAVGAKVAFIAYSHQSFWPHVRIANWTFTIALFTETTDCDSWLAPAHNQIGMML